jgi:hypothetical protein
MFRRSRNRFAFVAPVKAPAYAARRLAVAAVAINVG